MEQLPQLLPDDARVQISILVHRLVETERQLRALTGGNVAGASREISGSLRLGEEQFSDMFDTAATGIAVSTPHGRYLQANAAYCRMLGYTEGELQQRDFASLTHPDDMAVNLRLRDELLAGQRDNLIMEKRYLTKSGDIQWARISVSAARAASGEITTLLVLAEDIAERKRAELRLNRLNRLHTVLSKIGEAIVRRRERRALYEDVCRIVVEDGLLRMVFIAELDPEARLARPVVSHGEGLEYLLEATNAIPVDGGDLSLGTVGTALRTDACDVCNDIAVDGRMAPWREAALKNGLRANASFPLRLQGATFGVLTMYAGEANYFQDDEIGLMVAVADNLSFALDALEQEQHRHRAETLSARLAAIVESSDDAIIGKDPDGIITSWNKGAEKIFGYSAQEMAGTSIMRLVPADRQDEETRILRQIGLGQNLENFETLGRAKDGRLIHLSVTASPIRNAAGDVAGVSTVARDITLGKKTAARFRRLVDSNAQGVFFWNIRGGIIEANDAFLTLVRYTREDLAAGRISWAAMTPPEYAEIDREALAQCAATGVCTSYEKEYICKDGARVAIVIGAATFEDNPDEGVCFVLDLTERKKLEQQFRQAQKMEGIGLLAGGVAHDFNNLLAVIQMQADALRYDSELSADQAESADEIVATVERAAALTRQLLLFSSREVFQPQDIDLNESITDTIKMLKRIVGEHIQIQLKIASQPMLVHADPGMMDQVLLNLVVNARDAMPDGGGLFIETSGVEFDELAVFQSAQIRLGSFVCLSVSDSGCGISPDILPKIFEPFFTTKDVGKGTGLGLATVFGIARQHQGWVSAYSEVGYGATFRVYIPRLAINRRPMLSSQAVAAMPGGSETILLVEDDPNVRVSVQMALSRLGYRVLEAPTGIKALDVWTRHRSEIALLLTDLVMPDGVTGYDLAQNLLREAPGLKVIYMSGYSAEVIRKERPITEGTGFLAKPFQAHRLAQTVRSVLDRD